MSLSLFNYAISSSFSSSAGNIYTSSIVSITGVTSESITFTTAFPNTNYSIIITGEDQRTWTAESKLAGSFVINSNSNTSLTGNTYWTAISYGEFTG